MIIELACDQCSHIPDLDARIKFHEAGDKRNCVPQENLIGFVQGLLNNALQYYSENNAELGKECMQDAYEYLTIFLGKDTTSVGQ